MHGPKPVPTHTTTQNHKQARTLVPGKEHKGHDTERGGNTSIGVYKDTQHNTNGSEWMEEEQFGDQWQTESEQENVLQQVDETVASQTGGELPNNDQISQPEVRRSAREKRPPRMLMYDSLGQPSYQPICNTVVGAFRPPPVPTWPMQTYPVTYHLAFQVLQYPILTYHPSMQYTPPF